MLLISVLVSLWSTGPSHGGTTPFSLLVLDVDEDVPLQAVQQQRFVDLTHQPTSDQKDQRVLIRSQDVRVAGTYKEKNRRMNKIWRAKKMLDVVESVLAMRLHSCFTCASVDGLIAGDDLHDEILDLGNTQARCMEVPGC